MVMGRARGEVYKVCTEKKNENNGSGLVDLSTLLNIASSQAGQWGVAVAEDVTVGAVREVDGTGTATTAASLAPIVPAKRIGTDASEALRWRITLDAATVQTYYYNKRTIYGILYYINI